MHCTINEVSTGTADLVIFTEEILNGKLHFLCSDEYDCLQNFLLLFMSLLTVPVVKNSHI